MKLKLSHITIGCLFVGLTIPAIAAHAQENRPYHESEVPVKEVRVDVNLPDTDPTPTTATRTFPTRDSVQIQPKTVKPTTVKPVEKSQKEKPEDPLSFNFLYYIIEKFKLSDMIE
jgi:hypothetical protein